MDWEFKILDAIQKYFSGNFMDNIMSKISSLGNAGLIWIILTIILLLYVGLDHSKLESILILL